MGSEMCIRDRVKAAWCKWREMGGVVCDKKMPALLKAQVNKTVVRPVLVYAAETRALSKKDSELLERTEMRMHRWILGVSRRDRIRNENIRKRLKVLCITEKIRTTRLRWVGHKERSEEEGILKRARNEKIPGRRARGRPKLRWSDVVEREWRRGASRTRTPRIGASGGGESRPPTPNDVGQG